MIPSGTHTRRFRFELISDNAVCPRDAFLGDHSGICGQPGVTLGTAITLMCRHARRYSNHSLRVTRCTYVRYPPTIDTRMNMTHIMVSVHTHVTRRVYSGSGPGFLLVSGVDVRIPLGRVQL